MVAANQRGRGRIGVCLWLVSHNSLRTFHEALRRAHRLLPTPVSLDIKENSTPPRMFMSSALRACSGSLAPRIPRNIFCARVSLPSFTMAEFRAWIVVVYVLA